jgi:hypothetical protein
LQALQHALREQEARNLEFTQAQLTQEKDSVVSALKQQNAIIVQRLQEELDAARQTGTSVHMSMYALLKYHVFLENVQLDRALADQKRSLQVPSHTSILCFDNSIVVHSISACL